MNILVTNSGILDERIDGAIWDMPLEAWEAIYQVNARGVFLAIKHFLQSARTSQDKLGSELNNLSIVVMGKVGHGEDAQCALVRGVKNEIGQLNNRARINAVVPGSDVVKTQDITRAMAFLTSHRAAGHISGQCLRVDTRMGDRLVWIEDGVMKTTTFNEEPGLSITRWISKPKNKIRIAVSVDLDAVSGWLGTGRSCPR